MFPRLSVVIPVKDCLPYLPGAIDSIRRQGIDDIETVVIDDQPTDGLVSIAGLRKKSNPILT